MNRTLLQRKIESLQQAEQWSKLLAGSLITLGALVLLGWTFDADILKRPHSGLAAMNPLTAVCFILSALSLLLQSGYKTNWKQQLGLALAYLLLAIGIIELGDLLLGFDAPMDTWLFHDKLARDIIGNLSNRMAPNTALGFVLTAAALILLNKQVSKKVTPYQYPALLASTIGMLAILGYIYRVPSFYILREHFPMAFYTGIGFLMIANAILFTYPGRGFMVEFYGATAGAVIARKLIPVAFIIPVVVGLVRFYSYKEALISSELGITLHVLANMILFLIPTWFIIRELNRKDALRKDAEEQLKVYKHFFDNSKDLFCIGTAEGYFKVLNPQFEKVLGYSEKELVENKFYKFIHPDDIAATTLEVERQKSGLPTINFVNRYRKQNGEYLWFEWNSTFDAASGNHYAVVRNITKGKEIEENLKKSLRELSDYKYAIDEASIVAITDQHGIIKHVNDNFCKISKYNREELIGNDHRIINSGHHSKEFFRELWGTVQNGKIWRGEIKNKAKDGTFFWLDTSIIPFLDGQGKPIQYLAIRIDITERKNTELFLANWRDELEKNVQKRTQELADIALKLNRAQEVAHLGSWEISFATGVALWSDEACRIYGLDPSDNKHSYEDWLSFVHPEDIDFVIEKVNAAQENFKDSSFYYRIIRKDGIIRHLYGETKFQFDPNGRPTGMFGINHDVTEIKNTQKSLEKWEANLRAIFDNTTAGFLLLDGDFNVISFNKQLNLFAKNALGVDLTENVNVISLLLPEKQEELKQLSIPILHGEYVNIELEYPQTNGEVNWYNLKGSPVRNQHQEITGICYVVNDVTEMKQAEERIRQLNVSLEKTVEKRTAELTAVNQELEAFSYSVSHDLRAPLRAINGFTRILQEDYGKQLDREAWRVMNNIMNNAKKMGQLIDDLLAFSRHGRSELRKSPVNMEKMASDVCEEIKSAQQMPIAEFHIKPLPPAHADNTAIKQVWVNLISNAMKYSKLKEKPLIEIGAEENGKEIIYYVKDNGAGFDMRYADKLFGVFQRLHVDEAFEGTGVGLAIVQRIITKHGGRVWAKGEVNQGATFNFALPKN